VHCLEQSYHGLQLHQMAVIILNHRYIDCSPLFGIYLVCRLKILYPSIRYGTGISCLYNVDINGGGPYCTHELLNTKLPTFVQVGKYKRQKCQYNGKHSTGVETL
jgi:hypothetical protein